MLSLTQRISATLIVCLLVVAVLSNPAAARGEGTARMGIVIADRLNLRSGPGLDSVSLDILESGTRVKILGREKGWLKVVSGRTSGYVRGLPEYIQVLADDVRQDVQETRLRLLEEKASRIEKDIEVRQEEVRSLSGREAAVLDALHETERSLNRLDRQQIRIQSQLGGLKKKVETLEKHSLQLTRQVTALKEDALKRLVALYKLNRMGTLPFLVSARSVHEYLYLEEGLGRILEQDEAVLSALSEKKAALRQALGELRKKEKEKEALEQTYRSQIQAVAAEKDKRAGLLKAIWEQKGLQLAALQDLNKAADRLEETLKSLRHQMKPGGRELPSDGAFSAMKGLLEMPVEGKIVGRFGVYKSAVLNAETQRNGIEIEAGEGSPVKAVFGGKVVFSDWFRGYGNLIIIDHGQGFFTVYARARELFKGNGESVESGEVIATVGESGSREGRKLYFEVRSHEKAVDPLIWLKAS